MEFHIFKGANGQWYWRLLAGNKQVIATGGEGYVNKADCQSMVEHIKMYAGTTPIKEDT